jgi:hypothetical protein
MNPSNDIDIDAPTFVMGLIAHFHAASPRRRDPPEKRNSVCGSSVLGVMRATLAFALGLMALPACHPTASGTSLEEAIGVTSAAASEGARETDGFAMVELFTSEGCSSCPSADAVLGDIVRAHDPRVFPLAFHVDYWNSLGWPDRFSTSDRTDRQRLYAGAFGTGSVYTPQMIVGGVDQFTGSDSSQAASAIAHALASSSHARLSLTAEASGPREVVAHFHAESAPEGSLVHVAVTERGLVTRVLAGENRGRTLPHENVVRAFASATLKGADGVLMLRVPPEVDRGHAEVVGYVQAAPRSGQRGMPVLAAARVAAPSAK